MKRLAELFARSFKKDFTLWLYCLLFQQIGRLLFIAALFHQLQPSSTLKTIATAALHGARFDSLWACVWVLLPLIPTCLTACACPLVTPLWRCSPENAFNRLDVFRPYWAAFFTLVTCLIYVLSIKYYQEYRDFFNQMIFGLWYDDVGAILTTLWKSYHPLPYLGLIAALAWISLAYFKALWNPPPPRGSHRLNARSHFISLLLKRKNPKPWFNYAQVILICLFYLAAFRGGFGKRPIQLKDAGVTTDSFLNKAIVSPYSALRYAIKDHFQIQKGSGLDKTISSQDMLRLSKAFYQTEQTWPRLSHYMQKTAKGRRMPKPDHIFLIIGESLDSWPLQPDYRSLNLTPHLQKLSKQGLSLAYFLPEGDSTAAALNTIISGLLEVGLMTNYQPSASRPYATSIAPQFKQLGYTPQFFYGGYLSWQRIEQFAQNQGFNSVFGASHMQVDWLKTNEWGVDDRALFDFVFHKISSSKNPTFNLIMTTSNHPPFSIPLEPEGFDGETIHLKLQTLAQSGTKISTTTTQELGHIWYADKTIGAFIQQTEQRFPKSLFIITGDHFGRRHLQATPSLYERASVPLILYGNQITDFHHFPPNSAGSHLDIAPTLLEMIAPKGFTYYSLGHPLFSQSPFAQIGIGSTKIITRNQIAETSGEIEIFSHNFLGLKGLNKTNGVADTSITTAERASAFRRQQQAKELSWWYVKKGDALCDTCVQSDKTNF